LGVDKRILCGNARKKSKNGRGLRVREAGSCPWATLRGRNDSQKSKGNSKGPGLKPILRRGFFRGLKPPANPESQIFFMESSAGAYDIALYDPNNPNRQDMLLPFKNKEKPANERTMTVCAEVEPGKSTSKVIKLPVSATLMNHPGQYILVVSRLKMVNRVKIISAPFALHITSK
jgi:hypothetical protein